MNCEEELSSSSFFIFIKKYVIIYIQNKEKVKIKMKVIFLDFDGVLNGDNSKSYCGDSTGLDLDKLRRIARIVNETGAAIVLSTSWRYWMREYDHCRKYVFRKFNQIKLRIAGQVVDIAGWQHRGQSIKDYLRAHPEISSYCILDNEDFDFEQENLTDHFVKTNTRIGITDEDVERAIDMLNGAYFAYSYNLYENTYSLLFRGDKEEVEKYILSLFGPGIFRNWTEDEITYYDYGSHSYYYCLTTKKGLANIDD